MRIDYHRTLIGDHVRNAAFRDALTALIRPGETSVADIGAGTGLIGLMAARLGAREVFLYEAAEVAGVAAAIIKRNRAAGCHLIPCHSTEMQDPPRVDLVVSETLGNYPFEEDIIDTLDDARTRFLKPGGVIVPDLISQYVAPVVTDRIHVELCAWDHPAASAGLGLDLSPAKALTLNNVYVRSIRAAELLAAPSGGIDARRWDEIDLTRRSRSARHGEASWRLAKATAVSGFATWWTARLAPGVTLSTAPDAQATHWEQLYFPLARPLLAAAGETIAVSLRSRSSRQAGTHLAWTASRLAADGRRLDRLVHDLDKGYLP